MRVVAERRPRRDLVQAALQGGGVAGAALDAGFRLREAGRARAQAGERDARPRALLARERNGDRDRDQGGRRRQHRHPLEGGPLRHARDHERGEEAAGAEVLRRLPEEAEGGALERARRQRHLEDRVEGEQGRHHLGVVGPVDGLASDGGHAPDHPRRGMGAGGQGEEAGGGLVHGPRVDEVLECHHRSQAQVAVRDLDPREPERGEVEDVRDLARGAEQAGAAGEGHHALAGQVERLLEARGPVIAADAPREHPGILVAAPR